MAELHYSTAAFHLGQMDRLWQQKKEQNREAVRKSSHKTLKHIYIRIHTKLFSALIFVWVDCAPSFLGITFVW